MRKNDPNPASTKEKAESGRKDPNREAEEPPLHGKTDSGPEPEVHDRDNPGE
jgi:hypothetical protein